MVISPIIKPAREREASRSMTLCLLRSSRSREPKEGSRKVTKAPAKVAFVKSSADTEGGRERSLDDREGDPFATGEDMVIC